jgi:S-ribosylhomocysteine lyase
MKRIASFETDHTKLSEGLYVARTDVFGGEAFTTFDLRFIKPNTTGILSTGCMHAIEHLGATYFRNDPAYGAKTVYFGPMGCRTGFYLILHGTYRAQDMLAPVSAMLEYIASYKGVIPGASEKECGNYQDMSLEEAKAAAKNYAAVLKGAQETRLNYPA